MAVHVTPPKPAAGSRKPTTTDPRRHDTGLRGSQEFNSSKNPRRSKVASCRLPRGHGGVIPPSHRSTRRFATPTSRDWSAAVVHAAPVSTTTVDRASRYGVTRATARRGTWFTVKTNRARHMRRSRRIRQGLRPRRFALTMVDRSVRAIRDAADGSGYPGSSSAINGRISAAPIDSTDTLGTDYTPSSRSAPASTRRARCERRCVCLERNCLGGGSRSNGCVTLRHEVAATRAEFVDSRRFGLRL